MEFCILFNATQMDYKLEIKNKFKKYKAQHYSLEFYLTCQEIKGTVSVISSDPPCKDGNALFSAIALKALPDEV